MFESSNFLYLMQVSSHGFLQIYKYMENLEFHFSFFLENIISITISVITQ